MAHRPSASRGERLQRRIHRYGDWNSHEAHRVPYDFGREKNLDLEHVPETRKMSPNGDSDSENGGHAHLCRHTAFQHHHHVENTPKESSLFSPIETSDEPADI